MPACSRVYAGGRLTRLLRGKGRVGDNAASEKGEWSKLAKRLDDMASQVGASHRRTTAKKRAAVTGRAVQNERKRLAEGAKRVGSSEKTKRYGKEGTWPVSGRYVQLWRCCSCRGKQTEAIESKCRDCIERERRGSEKKRKNSMNHGKPAKETTHELDVNQETRKQGKRRSGLPAPYA